MKKGFSFLGLLMIMSININALEVDYSGYVRLGYQDFDYSSAKDNDMAIGGKFNIELQNRGYFALGASIYSSMALLDISNEGTPFYSSEDKSYAILGEAYLRAKFSKTKILLGRYGIDTPYANTDDYGMVPNTFEGVSLESKDITNSKIALGYLYRWSGVDTPNLEEFNKLNGDEGLWYVGYVYSGLSHTKLKAWYYNLPDTATMSYFEANYDVKLSSVDLTLSAQYGVTEYENGDESTLYGLMVEASHEASGLGVMIAYNEVEGVAADYFFGGGPFFTGIAQYSIVEGGDNANNLLLGASWNAASIGLEDLTLSLQHLTIEREVLDDITELDIGVAYDISKKLHFELVYSDVEDKSIDEESFTHLRAYLNYNF